MLHEDAAGAGCPRRENRSRIIVWRDEMTRRVKIVATIGSASEKEELLEELILFLTSRFDQVLQCGDSGPVFLQHVH